jgi:hypothetical protein
VDPLEAVLLERELAEERRGVSQGVDGRAEVVNEAGKCDLRRARAPAGGLLGLEHGYGAPVSSQFHSGGETVRPRAHNYRVVRAASGHQVVRRRTRPRIQRAGPAIV